MTKEQVALLDLVKTGASGICGFSEAVFDADWSRLYELAQQQGVAAVAWRGVEVLYELGSKSKIKDSGFNSQFSTLNPQLKLQWYVTAQQLAKQMQKKKQVSLEFAEKIGLPCVVLKGLDYCRFWPDENWRGFGDLDIWAMSEVSSFKFQDSGNSAYAQLNARAREIGCEVEDDGYYKHSEIRYNGLLVENHQFFTMFDGTKSGKMLERELRALLTNDGRVMTDDGLLYSPSPTFTALFMLLHAHEHFFWEGFSLKIVMDWLFFLRSKEAGRVDWQRVTRVLEEAGMKGFMDVMTEFCEQHLGLVQSGSNLFKIVDLRSSSITTRDNSSKLDSPLAAPSVQNGSKLLDEFTEVVFEKPVEGGKVMQLLRRFKRMWKFRSFLGESLPTRIVNTYRFNYRHEQPEL